MLDELPIVIKGVMCGQMKHLSQLVLKLIVQDTVRSEPLYFSAEARVPIIVERNQAKPSEAQGKILVPSIFLQQNFKYKAVVYLLEPEGLVGQTSYVSQGQQLFNMQQVLFDETSVNFQFQRPVQVINFGQIFQFRFPSVSFSENKLPASKVNISQYLRLEIASKTGTICCSPLESDQFADLCLFDKETPVLNIVMQIQNIKITICSINLLFGKTFDVNSIKYTINLKQFQLKQDLLYLCDVLLLSEVTSDAKELFKLSETFDLESILSSKFSGRQSGLQFVKNLKRKAENAVDGVINYRVKQLKQQKTIYDLNFTNAVISFYLRIFSLKPEIHANFQRPIVNCDLPADVDFNAIKSQYCCHNSTLGISQVLQDAPDTFMIFAALNYSQTMVEEQLMYQLSFADAPVQDLRGRSFQESFSSLIQIIIPSDRQIGCCILRDLKKLPVGSFSKLQQLIFCNRYELVYLSGNLEVERVKQSISSGGSNLILKCSDLHSGKQQQQQQFVGDISLSGIGKDLSSPQDIVFNVQTFNREYSIQFLLSTIVHDINLPRIKTSVQTAKLHRGRANQQTVVDYMFYPSLLVFINLCIKENKMKLEQANIPCSHSMANEFLEPHLAQHIQNMGQLAGALLYDPVTNEFNGNANAVISRLAFVLDKYCQTQVDSSELEQLRTRVANEEKRYAELCFEYEKLKFQVDNPDDQ